MSNLELLAEVALLRDLPGCGLVRGQVGTVVEILSPDAFEVDFCNNQGHTFATASLQAEDLVRLGRDPMEQIV